jgi:hypothetical protein
MTQLFSQWFNCLGATCPKETLAIILTGFRPSFHKHAPYFERPWSNFDLDFQWAAFLAFDAEGSQAFYVGWNPFVAGPRALVFSDANSFRGGAFQVTALPSCKSISTAIDNVFGSRSAVEKGRAFAV